MDYRTASRIADRMRRGIWEKDWNCLRYVGNRFERGSCYREAWKSLAACTEGQTELTLPIWQGPQHPCRRLLILERTRDLGDELRIIRFVAHAARDVRQVTARVEARLIPLLQRSFPTVEFVDRTQPLDPASFSHMAAQERLAYWYGTDDEAIRTSFLPLVPPDAEEPAQGIGIAWYSRAIGKSLPSIDDWAHVLSDLPGRIQSLQYRERDAMFHQLSAKAGRPIKTARRVNQKKHLDQFAAQVAGVRGVLTISNTTAHMAGALGIPSVVVLDNGIVTTWPYVATTTPFYPHCRLIRREQGTWREALLAGRAQLLAMIDSEIR